MPNVLAWRNWEDRNVFLLASEGFSALREGGTWRRGHLEFHEIKKGPYERLDLEEAEALQESAKAILGMGLPSAPSGVGSKFRVFVDDNFHYTDESERFEVGVYATREAAIGEAKRIVEESLRSLHAQHPEFDTEKLYRYYTNFGDDPFVCPDNSEHPFSAWEYARNVVQHIVKESDEE